MGQPQVVQGAPSKLLSSRPLPRVEIPLRHPPASSRSRPLPPPCHMSRRLSTWSILFARPSPSHWSKSWHNTKALPCAPPRVGEALRLLSRGDAPTPKTRDTQNTNTATSGAPPRRAPVRRAPPGRARRRRARRRAAPGQPHVTRVLWAPARRSTRAAWHTSLRRHGQRHDAPLDREIQGRRGSQQRPHAEVVGGHY